MLLSDSTGRILRPIASQMSEDMIIIARHGKPALSRKIRLDWRGYRAWWKQYDKGTIIPEQIVPKRLKEWAERADVRLSSPLPRAVDSLKLATGQDPDQLWPELVEAALPPPHLGRLKFRPKTWGTLSRIVWYCFALSITLRERLAPFSAACI